jgi:hypothetical protein
VPLGVGLYCIAVDEALLKIIQILLEDSITQLHLMNQSPGLARERSKLQATANSKLVGNRSGVAAPDQNVSVSPSEVAHQNPRGGKGAEDFPNQVIGQESNGDWDGNADCPSKTFRQGEIFYLRF